MKYSFLIFFTIILAIYFSANWYLYSRGIKATELTGYKQLFTWIFWILVLSFPVGQFLERAKPNDILRVVSLIGSFYLVVLLYSLLMVVFIDFIRLIDGWTGMIPQNLKDSIFSGRNLFAGVTIISIVLLIIGNYNAINAVIRKYEINIDKPLSEIKEIKAVLVSDIHMGTIIQNNRILKLVNQINDINPDLILFAGDLVDHNPNPVIEKEMGKIFLSLHPKYGMYAVTGNHEFIGHAEISIDYLTKYGIRYIRDTVLNIDDKFYVAGREDKTKRQFTGEEGRKPLDDILKGLDRNRPLILMDHQPLDYDLVEVSGVDLMVSGHTHKGQLWPFGYITSMLYDNHYGLLKKGKSYFYTSSGYGTWGPPVRIGTRSEIVEFIIRIK